MGIFSRRKEGFRCETSDGINHHCQVFEADNKEGKISTGTDFSVQVSRENNCTPIILGNADILDSDQDKVNKIIEQRVKACKQGLG